MEAYCPEGYGDYGKRFNQALGRIIVAPTHEACGDRCTEYSGPQYAGGCRGYMTGMYAGMLFCRSYGGQRQDQPCAPFAHPREKGQFSGRLGSTHERTFNVNIGGNCCMNTTFVKALVTAENAIGR